MPKLITVTELAKHNKKGDCWVSIDGKVFDVSTFIKDHPGGQQILLRQGGTECSELFHEFHNKRVLKKFGAKLYIGDLDGGSGARARF